MTTIGQQDFIDIIADALASPVWLQTDWTHGQFGQKRISAITSYVRFIQEGVGLRSIWTQLQGKIYLGSEEFVLKMQAQIEHKPTLDEIPRAQRRIMT